MELSKRTYRQFFSAFGFEENPFQYTNADEEVRLADYFVPPSYFPSVFGDPDHAKSFVVFAPRGGGKTAQRRMIEKNCTKNKVLAITYDKFEFHGIKKASEITLDHHLQNILRFVLMGILVTIYNDPNIKNNLTKNDREILIKLSANSLDGIQDSALKDSLDSLKSLKDKVKDLWNEYLPLIQMGITAFLKIVLSSDIGNLSKYITPESSKAKYLKHQLELLVDISNRIGYKSIYVLIDRVDESELTGNDSSASFQLVKPLLLDLQLLETKGVAFKFFLWDSLEPYYSKIARTDRIKQETLEWDDDLLTSMWNKRLAAFSNGKVSELSTHSENIDGRSIDELALIFANRSPRDMIRIGDQIIAEQQDININSDRISEYAISKGIEKFCAKRADEVLSGGVLNDLRKIRQVDFTIPYLSNQIFKEKQSTTRNRIRRWRAEGAIVDVEKVENPNPERNTQVKIMAILDIRVAKVMFSNLDLPTFLKAKYKKCRCGTALIRDWNDTDCATRCHECQHNFAENATLPEDDDYKIKLNTASARKTYRMERINPDQPSLLDDFFENEKQ